MTSSNSITETASSMLVESPLLQDTCNELEIIKTFYKKSGFITSPGYDGENEYPSDSICNWVVTSEVNEIITLVFLEFDLEHTPDCLWDSVMLYDGDTPSDPLLGQFCGGNIPPVVTSSGPFLRIRFRSDRFHEMTGFQASICWVASYIILYSNLLVPNGMVVCPVWHSLCDEDRCIPSEWLCDGEVDCESGEDEHGCGNELRNGEFRCSNGDCIPNAQRCDGNFDCVHHLDEVDCGMSRGPISAQCGPFTNGSVPQ
ncbi:hypothetical protein ScPMuIL_005884 [Solemya velum]